MAELVDALDSGSSRIFPVDVRVISAATGSLPHQNSQNTFIAMATHITNATEETFSSLTGKGLVLVDFHAEWCGPCRMLSPVVEALAEKLHQQMGFVKVNTDDCPKVSAKLEVSSIPTLLVFKEGVEVHRSVGVKDETDLMAILKVHLN